METGPFFFMGGDLGGGFLWLFVKGINGGNGCGRKKLKTGSFFHTGVMEDFVKGLRAQVGSSSYIIPGLASLL